MDVSTSAKSVQKKKTPECHTRQIDAQAHKRSLEHLPFPPGFARTLGPRRPHAWPSPAPADGRDGAISCSDPANDCWEEYLAAAEEAEEADRPILPHPRVAVSPRSRGAPCAGCPGVGTFRGLGTFLVWSSVSRIVRHDQRAEKGPAAVTATAAVLRIPPRGPSCCCSSVGCERLGVPVWHSRDGNIAGWRRDSSVAGEEGLRKVRPSA